MKRKIFGIIAAQVADVEQREILHGIMESARLMNIDIVVLSNIYNPNEPNSALDHENAIYDLILSPEFDGFILISEVFINLTLQQLIIQNLQKQPDIPVIAIGTPLPGFVLPHFKFINTDDAKDIEDVTNHLIEVHGFRNIDILTGHSFIEASHLRVKGYEKALAAHGIPFDETKVFYGDFWMNSGQSLALKYIQKSIPMPEAVICTNDYMAYGLLDTFMDYGIQVPDDITVVGYEYIRKRFCHTPVLTTYERNRKALGSEAVRLLSEKTAGRDYPSCPDFPGTMIRGNSCPCGISQKQLNEELKELRAKQVYDFLVQCSQFDHCLTECSDIYDFVRVCREFKYLLQHVEELYLCLYDSWYENAVNSDTMICYSILSEQQTIPLHRYEFSKLFSSSSSAYYLNPLFCSGKTLGYAVLKCSTPDAYQDTIPNWLKSVSNGLEVLHMKNDIQYLTKCRNLSGQRDSLTNLYNKKGMESVYHSLKSTGNTDFTFILFKVCIFDSTLFNVDQKISAILDAADAVKEFCRNNDVCGRINDTLFACFVHNREADAALLADELVSLFLQKKQYIENYGMDSFLCLAVRCSQNTTSAELLEFSTTHFDTELKQFSEKRILPYYQEMQKIRTSIYLKPEENISADNIGSIFSFSPGHLRVLYKNCFGISIHQDSIHAKIAKAKYLLCTTDMSIRNIADACGYHDEKYFLRQFSKAVGCTPNQYRTLA